MQAQDLVSIPTLTPPLEFDQGGFRVSPPHPYFCPSAQYFVSIPTLTPPLEFDQGRGIGLLLSIPTFVPLQYTIEYSCHQVIFWKRIGKAPLPPH